MFKDLGSTAIVLRHFKGCGIAREAKAAMDRHKAVPCVQETLKVMRCQFAKHVDNQHKSFSEALMHAISFTRSRSGHDVAAEIFRTEMWAAAQRLYDKLCGQGPLEAEPMLDSVGAPN